MSSRHLCLALILVLAGCSLSACGGGRETGAPKPEVLAKDPVAAPVTYASVGVTLVAARRGYRPAVSRKTVVRLLRSSGLFRATSRPVVSLQAVKAADAPGGSYPAWVFTSRRTRPVSSGVPDTPDCTSVVIYDLSTRAWTWDFQSCPGGKHASPWCDSGCTPANQDVLDAAAGAAEKIAGAYYTGVVVSDPTNSVTVYLAHAPQSVIDGLNAARPGVYAIKNDAPRPLSAVMKLMRSFSSYALKPDGITISGYGPTQDGYLQVGVTGEVAEAQAKLDARYGPGIIKVVKQELASAASANGGTPAGSSH